MITRNPTHEIEKTFNDIEINILKLEISLRKICELKRITIEIN